VTSDIEMIVTSDLFIKPFLKKGLIKSFIIIIIVNVWDFWKDRTSYKYKIISLLLDSEHILIVAFI
jgi:hypothetical protein